MLVYSGKDDQQLWPEDPGSSLVEVVPFQEPECAICGGTVPAAEMVVCIDGSAFHKACEPADPFSRSLNAVEEPE